MVDFFLKVEREIIKKVDDRKKREGDRILWNILRENLFETSIENVRRNFALTRIFDGWIKFLLRHRLVKSLVEYFDFSGRISRDRGSRGRASWRARIYQALSRGGARILDKARCWAISNFWSCRNQVIDYLEIGYNSELRCSVYSLRCTPFYHCSRYKNWEIDFVRHEIPIAGSFRDEEEPWFRIQDLIKIPKILSIQMSL